MSYNENNIDTKSMQHYLNNINNNVLINMKNTINNNNILCELINELSIEYLKNEFKNNQNFNIIHIGDVSNFKSTHYYFDDTNLIKII